MALILFVSAWPLGHAVAQQLQSSPGSNNYGQVNIGTRKQFTFQLSNSGSKALTISSKQKNNKDFTYSHFPLPVTLQPGKGIPMTVNFTPSTAGTISATLTLTSNAQNSKLAISVSGTGVSPNVATLAVSPASLNFGNVTVGSSASLPLTLSAANGTVTISSAQSNSSEFVLSGITFPLTIASGQSATATVKFTPNQSGTASANLVLTSNAANSPTTVPLTGTGVAQQAHSADLSWTASQDIVTGYNIYRGATHGGPYSKINPVLDSATSYTDSSVAAGATYYYAATAQDSNGVESGYSNEVKVVIPTP